MARSGSCVSPQPSIENTNAVLQRARCAPTKMPRYVLRAGCRNDTKRASCSTFVSRSPRSNQTPGAWPRLRRPTHHKPQWMFPIELHHLVKSAIISHRCAAEDATLSFVSARAVVGYICVCRAAVTWHRSLSGRQSNISGRAHPLNLSKTWSGAAEGIQGKKTGNFQALNSGTQQGPIDHAAPEGHGMHAFEQSTPSTPHPVADPRWCVPDA
jgi:hypothetical protein